jgi:hypothetical protein
MAQYVLRPSSFQPNMVGTLYHVGLSNGTASYGYVFQNDGEQSSGMFEKSNVTDKQALIQYSSTNLIDRDLAYFPRVSQGDFSGGALQEVLLDGTKFLDSDMNITTPGYAQIAPTWTRTTVASAITPTAAGQQLINFSAAGIFAVSFGEANGHVYTLSPGGAVTTGTPVAASVLGLFTDGYAAYAGTSGNLYSSPDGVTWTAVTNGVNGVPFMWWPGEQGTNGHFAYYATHNSAPTGDSLFKVDLNASRPVAAASQPQVPTSANAFFIVDMVEYQGGIAILTQDAIAQGLDVWFHDGQNMTRIIRINGYEAQGMCSCLGNLYVSAQDGLTSGGQTLFQVGSGVGFQVVARPAIPNLYIGDQIASQPVANAEFVYWPVQLVESPLNLVSGGIPTPRILVYNTLTGAVSYLPNLDATDWGPSFPFATVQSRLRILAGAGAGVAFAYITPSNNAILQATSPLSAASAVYQTTAWIVSSKVDFSTPAISKRFRTIEIHHSPLAAGQSVLVRAFVDQDPLGFTTSLTPVPATATVTNSTLNSSTTTLTFGGDTVGKTLYYAVQLTAGTSQATTPKIFYTAIEAGGSWNWDFQFDCSSKRRTLQQGQLDGQGISGKDLYFLLRNSYENGNFLTLTLFGGLTYTVVVQSLEARNIAYAVHGLPAVKPDEEWSVHAVLTQVL